VDAALAIVSIAFSVTLGGLAVWMLTRLVRTIRALRGITTGMNDVMRWAAGQVIADSSGRGAVDGTVAGAPTLGPG
jgi:membrane-bound ClpP family serine protease